MRFSQINSINNNNLRVCSSCMCKHCLIIIIMKKMAPTISVSLHFVLNQRAPKKWTEFVLWNYRIVVEFMGMDLLIFPVVSDSKKKMYGLLSRLWKKNKCSIDFPPSKWNGAFFSSLFFYGEGKKILWRKKYTFIEINCLHLNIWYSSFTFLCRCIILSMKHSLPLSSHVFTNKFMRNGKNKEQQKKKPK